MSCILQDHFVGFCNRLIRRQWNSHGCFVADRYLDNCRAFLPCGTYGGADRTFGFGKGHARHRGRLSNEGSAGTSRTLWEVINAP